MRQILIHTLITTIITTALLLCGCAKERATTVGLDDGVQLSLNINGAMATASTLRDSRATAVDESAVNDLWVLQFKMNTGSTTDGTLVGKTYIATITDLAKIIYRPIKGSDMALYLIANSGNSSLFSSTADGTTLAAIKATTVNVTTAAGNNFPTEISANLPMVGQSANLTLTVPLTVPITVPITLTRTAAKVVLTIKNLLETGYPQLTVQSVQLKSVPTVYSMQVVDAAGGFTGTTYYPAASGAYFNDYTATTGNITTSTYYLAPNVRGISSNTNDRLKSAHTSHSGQGNFCTYVEINSTAKASASSLAVDVRHRLYLGGNNTNDFNLQSNTAYKVDVELTGINGNDARMRITSNKFDLIQGGTEGDHTSDVGDGWTLPVVGEQRDGGIVFWVDPANNMNYRVVSLDKGSNNIIWAASSFYTIVNANSLTDGKANAAAIKAVYDTGNAGVPITQTTFMEAFPAVATCYYYTGKDGKDPVGTWYLPALYELEYLWCAFNGATPSTWDEGDIGPSHDSSAQDKFDKYLTDAGGSQLENGYLLLSSTENYISGATYNTVFTSFFDENGAAGVDDKNTGGAMRCIRQN